MAIYTPSLYHVQTSRAGQWLYTQPRPRGLIEVREDGAKFHYSAGSFNRAEIKAGLESVFGKLSGTWPNYRAD